MLGILYNKQTSVIIIYIHYYDYIVSGIELIHWMSYIATNNYCIYDVLENSKNIWYEFDNND